MESLERSEQPAAVIHLEARASHHRHTTRFSDKHMVVGQQQDAIWVKSFAEVDRSSPRTRPEPAIKVVKASKALPAATLAVKNQMTMVQVEFMQT